MKIRQYSERYSQCHLSTDAYYDSKTQTCANLSHNFFLPWAEMYDLIIIFSPQVPDMPTVRWVAKDDISHVRCGKSPVCANAGVWSEAPPRQRGQKLTICLEDVSLGFMYVQYALLRVSKENSETRYSLSVYSS